MDYTELRNVFFEALKNLSSVDCPQLGTLETAIFEIACKRGYFDRDKGHIFYQSHTLQIRDLFWESIISGLLGIGGNESNLILPFFHITDFGKKCIAKGEISVYDPTGLIANLKTTVPNLDVTIEEYLQEALSCFGRNCFRSSTVMIGCAAECLFLMIVEAFKRHYSNVNQLRKFEKAIANCPIKRVFDEFQSKLQLIQHELKQNTKRDDWDMLVSGIFNLIRRYRNEAGHPTGITIEKETVLSIILLFREMKAWGQT
jgi:hypothetical protein